MQYLYIIKCQEFYKIGIANDVETRLAQLSTGNPFTLEVKTVYAFENAEVVERSLHQRYKDVRQRGEWFSLDYDDLMNIHRVCLMLGGSASEYTGEKATEENIEDAEESQQIQRVLPRGEDWRLESRINDRTNPGWAIMKRCAAPKVYLGYISSSDIKGDIPTREEVEIFLTGKL